MTDISIHYYDADSTSWIDLTTYAKAFKVQDLGILKVGTATINLEGTRSYFNSYLSNPHRLIRVRAKPDSTWQNLFFGYIDEPHMKTVAGTITERSVLSLDCQSFSARLAQDYKTYDYNALNSALYPSNYGLTYRGMLEDVLAYPDSRDDAFPYGTGFEIVAATDNSGIDDILSGIGNWDNQTLFEIVRLTAEQIGYDGYYYMADDLSATQIKLYPFSKAATATLTAPFIDEPEWNGGSLADVGNKIFVEGGVDAGIPSDGDRYTEYGYSKYSPVIWTAWTGRDSVTISDPLNTNFLVNEGTSDEYNIGAGTRSVKFLINGDYTIAEAALNLLNTEYGVADCKNRCSTLNFAFYAYTTSYNAVGLMVTLKDSSDNMIDYVVKRDASNVAFTHDTPATASLPVGINETINPSADISTHFLDSFTSMTGSTAVGKWYYHAGSTTFDWEHIKYVYFAVMYNAVVGHNPATWSFEIDALQFGGGKKISQFDPLNPPAQDITSINSYGMHPYKHTDAQITSFEQAQAEAARVLNNLHNPIPTLKVKKIYGTDSYGTTWATQLYPSNVVTCQTVDYRIANLTYEWKAENQRVDATYNLVTKTSPLPPLWTQNNELRLLVR